MSCIFFWSPPWTFCYWSSFAFFISRNLVLCNDIQHLALFHNITLCYSDKNHATKQCHRKVTFLFTPGSKFLPCSNYTLSLPINCYGHPLSLVPFLLTSRIEYMFDIHSILKYQTMPNTYLYIYFILY